MKNDGAIYSDSVAKWCMFWRVPIYLSTRLTVTYSRSIESTSHCTQMMFDSHLAIAGSPRRSTLSLNRMSSKHNVYSLFQFNFFKHLSSLSNRISILVFFIKRGKTNKKFFSQFFQNICASIVWLISEHFRRQRQKGIAILSYRIINGGRQYS